MQLQASNLTLERAVTTVQRANSWQRWLATCRGYMARRWRDWVLDHVLFSSTLHDNIHKQQELLTFGNKVKHHPAEPVAVCWSGFNRPL